MADDPLDYLGVQAPISLSEKPALPVGGPPAVGTAAGPVGGATGPRSAVGTVGGPVSSSGTVRTDASGQPGIPGVAAASALASPSEPDFNLEGLLGAGGKIADLIRRVFGLDGSSGSGSTLDPKEFSLGGAEGAPSLDPKNFSLGGLGEGSTLDPKNFSFNLGSLNQQLPDMDAPFFGFEDADAATGGLLGQALQMGSEAMPYASSAVTIGKTLLDAINSNDPAMAFVKSSPGWMPLISGLAAGVPLADLAASAGGGLFGAAWNAPALANGISEMVDPGPDTNPVTLQRRAGRNADAINLQQEILQPLFNAKTPEDFVSALGTEVGGSTAGDALANAIRSNLSGGWYTDTGHQWLPDASLVPTLRFLQSLGYTGDTSPKRGDVGGMGEIIAGGGSALVSPAQKAWLASSPSPGAGGDVPQASLGWESVLRDITGAVTGSPVTAPSGFDYLAHVPTGEIKTITSQQGDDTVTLPTDVYPQHLLADDSYRSTLQELASAGLMTQDELTKILGMSATPREDWSQAQYEGAQTAGGG